MSDYLERTNGGKSFSGSDVDLFRAAVIASALKIYAATGLKADRNYTPSAMLKAASQMTGRTFKRGQYTEAAEALSLLVDQMKREPRKEVL